MTVEAPVCSSTRGPVLAAGAAAATPLLTDLVAYWDLSEASGQRNDSHTSGYHLTDNNTVGSAAGVGGGQTAANFVAASSESLSRSEAGLNFTENDFSMAVWVRAVSTSARVFSSYNSHYCQRVSSSFQGRVNDSVSGDSIGSQTGFNLSTWYFFYLRYLTATKTAGISVNDNAISEGSALSNGVNTATGTWRIGTGLGTNFDGQIQAFGRWNRVLTAAEVTWLYNSGTAARLYADVSTYTG